MSSLLALLSQQTPNLQTRKGLILLGLQNDFVLPDGKLPVNDTGYLDRIVGLVPAFREYGDIIWVRSEFEATRPVNGLNTPGDTVIADDCHKITDNVLSPSSNGYSERNEKSPVPTKKLKVAPDFHVEGWGIQTDYRKSSPKSSATFSKPNTGENDVELFLSRTASREPCCICGSHGAEYADRIKPLIRPGRDLQVVKTHYSAFGATSLLMTLRSKLITELYVCGNMTNLSVYATAMDAARYGIRIILIIDCLGYRKQDRHDQAVKQLRDIMEADVIKSDKVINVLQNPAKEKEEEYGDSEGEEESEESDHENFQANRNAAHTDEHPIEADSETDEGGKDDEEDISLPFVRRTGTLGHQTLELRYCRDLGRHSLSPPAHPSEREGPTKAQSQPHADGRTLEPRSFHHSSHDRRIRNDSPKQNKNSSDISTPVSGNSLATYLLPSRSKHQTATADHLSASGSTKQRINTFQARGNQHETTMDQSKGKPLFGEDHKEESRGSQILYNLLPPDMSDTIFEKLKDEVDWQVMHHQQGEVPRLVCCQATHGEDGRVPIYRHPSDQIIPAQPWTPHILKVKQVAEKAVGHELNHALIQLYRNGNDFISEHSDKTLDTAPLANIVNISFGAQRTMRLRTKRPPSHDPQNPLPRTTYRVPMPHNSMITMSLETNAQYLHGIMADKRPEVELVEAEKAYEGQRISVTFRKIGTFLNADSTKIWGQGAVGKTKAEARAVINADSEETDRITKAFGFENQASTIQWEEIYGGGFDTLNLR